VVETDRPEAQIYQLRAVLRGISPLIWRRLLVRSDSTVARLHEVLQIAFGWDDEHLNRWTIAFNCPLNLGTFSAVTFAISSGAQNCLSTKSAVERHEANADACCTSRIV